MSTIDERLKKLREERIAREKARIERLRELNLKKYNKNEGPSTSRCFVSSSAITLPRTDTRKLNPIKTTTNFNRLTKRPITAPFIDKNVEQRKTVHNILKSKLGAQGDANPGPSQNIDHLNAQSQVDGATERPITDLEQKKTMFNIQKSKFGTSQCNTKPGPSQRIDDLNAQSQVDGATEHPITDLEQKKTMFNIQKSKFGTSQCNTKPGPSQEIDHLNPQSQVDGATERPITDLEQKKTMFNIQKSKFGTSQCNTEPGPSQRIDDLNAQSQVDGATEHPITDLEQKKTMFNIQKSKFGTSQCNTKPGPSQKIDHLNPQSHVNGTTEHPITDKNLEQKKTVPNTPKHGPNQKIDHLNPHKAGTSRMSYIAANIANVTKKPSNTAKNGNTTATSNGVANKTAANMNPNNNEKKKIARKSFVPKPTASQPKPDSRKTIQPTTVNSTTKVNPNHQSVFERLYQPKPVPKNPISEVEKIKTDPNYLQKVIKDSNLIVNKRHTCFETKKADPPVRRSISAVHFKRISSKELKNCIHKWSSIGEKLDKVHLKEVNEDEAVKEDKIVSAVKSERKKVQFKTPTFNLNTPKPEELQQRLHNWLKKRGKSLDSYHHLQCFGIHHLSRDFKPLHLEQELFSDCNDNDEENKENVPLDSDSDDGSYTDIMNEKDEVTEQEKESFNDMKWRRASLVSDVDCNESHSTTLTETMHHVDELLLGALNDLTELLREMISHSDDTAENFDWELCARWLRAIRQRFPGAQDHAAYWECRAALEERRGDFASSVECWEEAVVKGTERSVLEANLDQLLDKFMQLKISPSSGAKHGPNPKLVDFKNIFKSTLIRFAVQHAKLRQSQEPKFTITPVRRSARLSLHWSLKKTPLQECTSVKHASILGHPVKFVPNPTLPGTP